MVEPYAGSSHEGLIINLIVVFDAWVPPQKLFTLKETDYSRFKKALAETDWFFSEGRILFILCLGALRPYVVDGISQNSEIKIIWRGSVLPWWARPFGIISAAYGCIVRVDGSSGLRVACDNLLKQAGVEFLVVSEEQEIATTLQDLGRHACSFRLLEREAEGVLACIFIDDDSLGDYPVIYRNLDDCLCPVIAEYEKLDSSQSPSAQ